MADRRKKGSHQQNLVDAHFQSAAAYWKAIYEDGDLQSRIYQIRKQAVFSMVRWAGLAPGSSVLEVGCGAGYTTVDLAGLGANVEAIDTVGEMLELTRRLAEERGVARNIHTSIGDVHALRFPDASFDHVVAMGVLPWVHSPAASVKEMARVLRPGGWIIVTADNRWRLNHTLDLRLNPLVAPLRRRIGGILRKTGLRESADHAAPVRYHSIGEVRRLLEGEKLEIMKEVTVGFGPFSFFGKTVIPDPLGVRINSGLQRLADRRIPGLRSTGSHYIVLARKCETPLAS